MSISFGTRAVLLAVAWLLHDPAAFALGDPRYTSFQPVQGAFHVASQAGAAPLVLDTADWPGVRHATGDFAADVERVTGRRPEILSSANARSRDIVLIGTLGHSPLIDNLVRRGKLDPASIRGRWEATLTTVVEHPMPGVRRALVIVGSDKRGTIFGLYTLSEQIGVSPWYWWADVAIPHRDDLYVLPGLHLLAPPAVKYRGIFLNDEAPALTGWVNEKFGGYNSKFYVHVFELLLRMRANYLWPAMWNSAFNEDDPENPKLADEYGIVMGTSHHEPMIRAQQEWKRHGTGPWDYASNANVLQDFWSKGIERNKNYESTITLGMRGDGDKPMSETDDIALLEKIVRDQRDILARNMTPDIASEPKVWALYKEVQGYYDKGMRVPDDVTLLWCDDNWGNIRRLPTPEERKRPGGAGIYYHFDYVGGPRSYKWLNTYSITKVWEQMHLALEYGADRVWVVNVGDLKPMEFPIEFFLSYARDPSRWSQDRLHEYTVLWATREFGPEHAEAIASAVEDYTRYNSRRKPEQLEPTTFDLVNYDEAARVNREWRDLSARVDALAVQLPAQQRPSFFELVQYPVDASATVAEMYLAAGHNALAARQGRASANDDASETRTLFARDAALTAQYNHTLLNGRWDHMMDQTHLGYTFWNEPPANVMPPISEIQVPEHAGLGVSTEFRTGRPGSPGLGTINSLANQIRTITLFNRGAAPVAYQVHPSDSWIHLDRLSGTLDKEATLQVSIDWKAAPAPISRGNIVITQPAAPPITLPLTVQTIAVPAQTAFVETDDYVAIDAAHATATHSSPDGSHWQELPGFGETHSAMTLFPVTAPSNPQSAAGLDYPMLLTDSGAFTLEAILAPSLNFVPTRGLRFAVSIDDGPRTIVDALEHNTERDWERAVSDGVKHVQLPLTVASAGEHVLHVWAVDPGVVVERLILSHGPLRPSYLGPPESIIVRK